ncbi:hypothetical protein B0T21DRAFT_282846 [Apiosordaria backusii]|uniref:Uncharacterized protein n=1 Tax=Apiosordaria backusii TaxID=314023 RepID=A0AA40EMK9_9PEZI|nr:hypothetical protein B0T21DRAFT_282846 [Apiosordaria backusii]
MPRQGDGSSDNAIDLGHNIIHGAGPEKTTHVARADRVAQPPEPEKGAALEGLPASGGSALGHNQGARGRKA